MPSNVDSTVTVWNYFYSFGLWKQKCDILAPAVSVSHMVVTESEDPLRWVFKDKLTSFSGLTVFQLKSVHAVCAGINWLVAVYSGISQFVQTELFWAKSV